MKKILLLLCLIQLSIQLIAQSDSTKRETSVYTLTESSQGSNEKFGAAFYNELQVSFKGKKNWGTYVTASHQSGFSTIGLGILHAKSTNLNRWFNEIGLSYNVELEKGMSLGSAVDGYWYFASKAQEDHATGKVEIMVNPYYSFNYGWWHRAVGTYSIMPELALGIYSKTDVGTGPCLQASFHLFKKLNTQCLFAWTTENKTTLGVTIFAVL